MSQQIPSTPRVISPSPTPSESGAGADGYFGPVTRSSTKKRFTTRAAAPIDEELDGLEDDGSDSSEAELRRARSRSRPAPSVPKTKPASKTNGVASSAVLKTNGVASSAVLKSAPITTIPATNGHLSPTSAADISTGWSWRDFSRSPSPLGLIPIHRHWRTFVHKHEVPRKLLHVSIGFFTIWAYVSGIQTTSITPWLMSALIPIATVDFLRHQYVSLNRVYVRVMGAFMRETEYEGWNGVIWYLLGVWIVLTFFSKDVGMLGVLLLSWCDTAASTFGRAYGRYTPRLRKGKSLAGSLGALVVGVLTAVAFWGYIAPLNTPHGYDEGWPFMYTGQLCLPSPLKGILGLSEQQGNITGVPALTVMSLCTGFIASASELVDIFGFDDNLTIPVLSGIGLWGFLKVFG